MNPSPPSQAWLAAVGNSHNSADFFDSHFWAMESSVPLPLHAGSPLGHTTGTVLSAGGTSDTSSLQEVFPDSRAARGRVGDESSSGIFALLMRSTI